MFEPPAYVLDDAAWPALEEPSAWFEDYELDEADVWTDTDFLDSAVDQHAGPGLLMDLLCVDPTQLTADEAVTFAEQVDRFAAFAAGFQAKARNAVQMRLVDHFRAEDARHALELERINADAPRRDARRSGTGRAS